MPTRVPSPVDLGPEAGSSRRFGCHRLYPQMRLLLRGERKVELGGRAFDLLCALVEAEGRLVGKDELLDRVWGGAVVEENNLQTQVSALRKALGPDKDLISTEFGRGYRLLAVADGPGSEEPFSAGRAPRLATCTLPNPVTSLIGREAELSEVEALLGQTRLVTVVGPGGVGKTRLANEVGLRLLPSFPDGVVLAELGKLSDDDLVGATVGAALRIPASALRQPDLLRDLVANHRVLLVVDNCEHVADAVADVLAGLLEASADLRVLGTAQEPLGIPGEHVYRLPPLAVPSGRVSEAAEALVHPAVELFVERARAGTRSFRLVDANAADVGEICRRLDGIPLALELAAARVAALGVHGVLTGLDDRFRLLAAGRRAALARHRTLRGTVDWSHSLLGPDAQRLFRCLAVFPAEFSADAAHEVAADESGERWRTTDLLGELSAKSLLHVDVGGQRTRFRMLETIRFYALEKLAESGEVDGIARQHAAVTAAASERAARDWQALPTEEWVRSHGAGLDDVRAALDWAFSASGDARQGIAILSHSAPFWIQHSHHDEGQRRISEALAGDASRTPIPPRAEMAAQAALGTSLTWAKGPVAETQRAWSRALALAEETADVEVGLQAHYGLWLFHLRCGDYAGSLRNARQMMDRAKGVGDEEAFAAAQRIAGVSHHFLGRHGEGHGLIETSLAWYDRHRPVQRYRFGVDQHVAGLAFLSRILWIEGRSTRAVEIAADAIERARALDHACTLCCALAEGWCMVHALNGDRAAVARAAPSLVAVASQHGLSFWKVYGELFLAWATTRDDEPTGARIGRVLSAASGMDFDPLYSTLVTDLLLEAGPDHPAYEAGLRATRRVDAADGEAHWAWPEFLRVQALVTQASPEARERELRRALRVAERQGALALALRITLELVRLLTSDGRHEDATSLLGPMLDRFPDGTASRDWRAARDRYDLRVPDTVSTQEPCASS